MSYSLNVNIKFSDKDNLESKFLQLFEILYVFSRSNQQSINELGLFASIALQSSFNETAKIDIKQNEWFDKLIQFIPNNYDENKCIKTTWFYPTYAYEKQTDSFIVSSAPLEVRFYGKNYENGLHHRRFADVEISFENVGNFFITNPEKCKITSEGKISGEYKNKTYEDFIVLLKLIIQETMPCHLLAGTTDTEVNPLNSHVVFHRDLNDFSEDLKKIASMHKSHNYYFDEDLHNNAHQYEHSALVDYSYGYLRRQRYAGKAYKFEDRVEYLCKKVLAKQTPIQKSETEIIDYISSDLSLEFERTKNGLLVYVMDSPQSYIETPYCEFAKDVIEVIEIVE
jgi:hypothetical protein